MTEATSRVPISIAISTRDRPDALARCLQALVDDNSVPAEIVIVDQSTVDDTRIVVESMVARDTRLVYVKDDSSGLGSSQNRAVETATNDIVAVIDDDCVPGKGWVHNIAKTFEQSPDLGLVAGRVLPLGPPTPGFYPVAIRSSAIRRDFRGRTAPWEVGSGNNFAVRRTAFLNIGGCDTRLGPGAPAQGGVDMDLFYRLLRSGARGRYEPSLVVYHEQQSRSDRMERRPMYGFGTGACFAFWLKEGDLYAFHLLVRWMLWRSARLAVGIAKGDMTRAKEEAIMLEWTVRGFGYGLRLAENRKVPPSREWDKP